MKTESPLTIRLTEKYQVLPPMPPEQFEALKADIAERGVLVPIDVDEDGHILDGHHRYRACTELGITDFPTLVRPGLSEEDRRIFARKNNVMRRHLTRAQIRALIADQLRETPNWANNRVGGMLGVDAKTVATVRSKLETTSEIPKFDKLIGADGKERAVKQKRPPAIMVTSTEELARTLRLIEEAEDPNEVTGFVTVDGFHTIVTPEYDPFAHCDEEAKRQWLLFCVWLTDQGYEPEGAWPHTEWILQRQFKTPGEWLGEEGRNFRSKWMKVKPRNEVKTLKHWEAFLAAHDEPVEEIEARLEKMAAGK